MAPADSAHTTTLSDLSPADRKVVPLFHTPAGLSTDRPQADHPPIDRAALMRRAHQIAAQARQFMASYREALAYGLRAAWGMLATRREFAAVRARVAPVTRTAAQIEAGRIAMKRCGRSIMPF